MQGWTNGRIKGHSRYRSGSVGIKRAWKLFKSGRIWLEKCPKTFELLICHYVALSVLVHPNSIKNYNLKLYQKLFKIAITVNVQVSPFTSL